MNENFLLNVLEVTVPVFSMVILGALLKKVRLINSDFVTIASQLVFKATMPTLLFLTMATADLQFQLYSELILWFCIGTILTMSASWFFSHKRINKHQQGVFIQAGFRSNCGIIGLAFASSLYGDLGLQLGGMLAGVSTILYNILSPIVFYTCSDSYKPNLNKLVKNIVLNPLNIGILLGVFVSVLELKIPDVILASGGKFASLSLPLALICIGASLSIDAFKSSRTVTFYAVLVKLILSPLVLILALLYLGVRGQYLGVLFLFFASPTATASYIFAVMSGSDGKLAANIVVVSTIVSIPTTMIGLYVLYSNHLI